MANPEIKFTFKGETKQLEDAVVKLKNELTSLQNAVNSFSATTQRMNTSVVASARDLEKLRASLHRNTNALNRNSEAMNKAKYSAQETNKGVLEGVSSWGTLSSRMMKIVPVLASVSLAFGTIKAMVGVFAPAIIEVDKFHNTLKFASGSTEEYGKNLSFLQGIADKYKLNVLELGKSYAQLSVATRGTNLEGKVTKDLFEATAMAATAMQLSTDEVNGTFRAFIQMVSKGNVQAEELRGQLGDRLVGAFNMAAKSMGVSTEELNKMLKSGKVLASDLLPKMAYHMKETFSEGAIANANSLGAKMNYLKGETTMLLAEFADTSGIEAFFNEIVEGATLATKAMRGSLQQGGMLQSLFHVLKTNPAQLGSEWARAFGLGKNPSKFKEPSIGTGGTEFSSISDLVSNKPKNKPLLPLLNSEDTKTKLTALAKSEALERAREKAEQLAKENRIKEAEEQKRAEDALYLKLYEIRSKGEDALAKLSNKNGILGESDTKNVTSYKLNLLGDITKPFGDPKELQAKIAKYLTDLDLEKYAINLKIGIDAKNEREAMQPIIDRIDKYKKQLGEILMPFEGEMSNPVQNWFNNIIDSTEASGKTLQDTILAIDFAKAKTNFLDKLIETYGSIEGAIENGWGGVINSQKTGHEGLEEAFKAMKGLSIDRDFSRDLTNIFSNFGTEAFSNMGEWIGGAIAGVEGVEQLGDRISTVFSDLITSLGKALIQWGVVKAAADIGLKSGNPFVAIAAGVAAVAAGAALRASIGKNNEKAAQGFWTGGVVQGQGGLDRIPAMLTQGEMVLNNRQQGNLFRMLNGVGGINSVNSNKNSIFKVEITSKLRGRDIEQSVSKTSRTNSYFNSGK